MSNPRLRPIYYALGAVLLVWLLAWGGYRIAENSKVTADKLRRYMASVELSKLAANERARALRKLEDMINALSPDDRRQWRMEGSGRDWFADMTEDERGQFLEAIMPTGFKQMLDAFSELPEEKRKKVVDDAIRNLHKQATNNAVNGNLAGGGTNGPQPLSPELEQKVRAIGLKTFYSQGSAETKAELAPLIEELQRQVQSGRALR